MPFSIQIEDNGIGKFQFGYVYGKIDGKITKNTSVERFQFSWVGNDENDPANGCGWIKFKDSDTIEGEFRFHMGDDSTFLARRAKKVIMSKKSNKKKTKKKKAAVKPQKIVENVVLDVDETDDMDDADGVEGDIARVMKILNVVDEEDMEVNDNNLKTYFDYLNNRLDFAELLTGSEYFRWEEYYVFGPGDPKEYEKLKKKYPSYTDHYQILNLDEYYYDEGILINVKRISDKKKFTLPLAELRSVDKSSSNYQLLEDFSMWFWNYR